MELLKIAVDTVIEKERIGSPVFLRCVLHVASDTADLLQSAAEIFSLSNSWMPSKPESIYAQGDGDKVQITVMVQFAGGQMAVLCVNRVDVESAIDIMLIGNRGTIYYETPMGRHNLSGNPPGIGKSNELSETIANALASNQPIKVEDLHE